MTPPTATAAAPQVERRAAARPAPSRPAAAPARRPPLQVVDREPRRRPRRRRVAPVLSLALVVGSLMAVVVGHALLDQGQVRLATAQGSLAAAQLADHQATLKVSEGETPQRIVGEAIGQLHMVRPSQTVQLPYVPLDKPLPTPSVAQAPPAGTTAASGTSATVPGR